MATWRKSLNYIKSIFIKEEEATILSVDAPALTENKRGINYKLSRQYNWRVDLEMRTWKDAVEMAEDPIRPRRDELYRLYHRALEDDHLLSQIRTAIFTLRSGDFFIHKGDLKADEAKKELFARPWFREFLQYAVNSEMWGHSLLEFNPNMENGEFQKIELVPRLHVRPEYGEIVYRLDDESGVPYRGNKLSKYLLELGTPYDLGLLKVASKTIIRKEYSLTDWSRRNERYGMPFMVIKTSSRNKSELDEKQRMAENFGSNGWAILDDLDEIEFKESNQSFAYQSYRDFAEQSDQAISILINGQTGTTEEKAYVGSAEVHERILNTYTKDRMARIQNTINYSLIPFLIRHGYPLNGYKFQFVDLLKKESMPDNNDKGTTQKTDEKELSAPKKKSLAAPHLELIYKGVTCQHHTHEELSIKLPGFDLDKIVQKAIQKVYKDKADKGIDPDTWKYNVQALWQAAQEGAGQQLIDLEYTDTRFEMLTQLRNNIHVFAAFKNHANIKEMVEALTNEDGQLIEFKDFQVKAQGINAKYNKTWLETEYNAAVASAQMATKWDDYQRNKDLLPYLQYETQNDERVRASHKPLHGVTLPIDDSFWDQYYPPNDWGCRCGVIQIDADEAVPPTVLPDGDNTPPVFRNNVGKSKQIFPLTHPFFADIKNQDQRQRLTESTSTLVYGNYDDSWKKETYTKNHGYIVSHKLHGKQEYKNNLSIAEKLAAKGEAIELIEDHVSKKSPDATRNGLLWEFKNVTGKTKTAVQNAIKRGKNQSSRILLSFASKPNINDLTLAIYTAVVKNDAKEKVQSLGIMYKDTYIEVDRRAIENGNYIDKIKKAMK